MGICLLRNSLTCHFHLLYQTRSWLPKATTTAELRSIEPGSLTYLEQGVVEQNYRIVNQLSSQRSKLLEGNSNINKISIQIDKDILP